MSTLFEIAKRLSTGQIVTPASWTRTYKALCLAGKGWGDFGLGDTYAMALIHYHNEVLKPGSREWRPSKIVQAIRAEVASEHQ